MDISESAFGWGVEKDNDLGGVGGVGVRGVWVLRSRRKASVRLLGAWQRRNLRR